MSFNQPRWDSLRSKGHDVGDVYVQAGVGPAAGQMFVVIDGVAMPFEDARALDRGIVTLDEIAKHYQEWNRRRRGSPPTMNRPRSRGQAGV